jgi:thioredoxin 1
MSPGSNTRSALLAAAVVLLVVSVALLRQRAPSEPARNTETAAATQLLRLPRLVDLGADRCAACKQMAPILAELKLEYAGRATIEFIDVWKNPEAGKAYGVRIIPTQIFYDREGREVWRHEGFLPREQIIARLKELGAGGCSIP